MVPEVPLQPAGGGPTVVGTEFINVPNDDIEEVWRDHVATLLKGKSEAAAVTTMFLLNRLFLVSDAHALSRHYRATAEECGPATNPV